MSTPLQPWSTLTLDERTDAIVEVVLGGGTVMDLRAPRQVTAMELMQHLALPDVRPRALALLQEAQVAASIYSEMLKVAMVLNGTPLRDGLPHRELKMLIEKTGNPIQPPVAVKNGDKAAEEDAAMRLIAENQWKFGLQSPLGPAKAEA